MSAFHLEKPSQDWTEADAETVRTMWTEGKKASEIVVALEGRHNRNSVISKAHRMNLGEHKATGAAMKRVRAARQIDPAKPRPTTGHHAPKPKTRSNFARKLAVPKRKKAEVIIAIKAREPRDMDRLGILTAGEPRDTSKMFSGPAWEPLAGSNPVPLEMRTGCRWPLLESPFVFCNLDVDGEGQVYCATHRLKARSAAVTA